jgi:formate dehydrogenase iron-sulfur subunit
MSQGKTIIMDTTRCTACRGCQIACKQWNALPGTKTSQRGTYQNPADLEYSTWKVVRFSEGLKEDGKPYWYFFSDQCRHCLTPPCKLASDGTDPKAIIQDPDTGAVIPAKTPFKGKFLDVRQACPYDIPRQDEKSKVMAKCTMCLDRIQGGTIPACVKSCPTGSLTFGERDEMIKAAEARVAQLKTDNPKAQALDLYDVRVVFIVADDPKKYHKFAKS